MSDARDYRESQRPADDATMSIANGRFSSIYLRDVFGHCPPLVRPASADSISPDPQKYVVQGEIARGGIGIIAKGHDRDLGRDVALKFLRKQHRADPEALQRFVEEAQIGGQLQHPGIVPVYDLGVEAGAPYFTMQLIEGRTLAAVLADRTKPSDDRSRCLDVFDAVCRTMAYAHARGVVHRDLKPANIMVGAFGEVFVVDWGLAKVLVHGGTSDEKRQERQRTGATSLSTLRSKGPTPAHSTAGSVMGTAAYMPPEQALGEVEAIDERSDVFALGAVLCEILTGLPPYSGGRDDSLELARRCATQEALSHLKECDADASLVELCRQCLQASPPMRPRDASVVAASVAEYRHSIQERARAAQIAAAEERVRAAAARRSLRLTLALVSSVLLTLTLSAAWLWWSERSRQSRMERSARAVEAELWDAEESRSQGSSDGEREAVERAVSLAAASEVPPDLLDRVERAHARVAAEARERAFLEQLAQIATSAVSIDETTANSEPQIAARCAAYRKAFAAQRIDVDAPSPQAVRQLQGSAKAAHISAALDDWADATTLLHRARGSVGRNADFVAVLDLALAIDVDPMRRRLRRWWRERPSGARGARELDALLDGQDLLEQPPMTAIAIALLLTRVGAAERASRLLGRMTRKHPDDAILALRAGRAYQHPRVAKHVEAIRHLSVAVALSRGDPYPQQLLGVSLWRRNRFQEAASYFRQSIDGGLESPQAKVNLGLALCLLSRLDEAEPLLRAALEADADSVSAHVGLGMVLALKQQTQEARTLAVRALALAPRSAYAHAHKAWLLRLEGEHQASLASYRKAVELDPRNTRLRQGVAEQLGALQRRSEQIAEYEAILASRPHDITAKLGIARALTHAGYNKRALEYARQVLRHDPRNAEAHTLIGLLHASEGRTTLAVQSLERAVAEDRDYGEALAALGDLLVAQGDLARARGMYERALESNSAAELEGASRRIRERLRNPETVVARNVRAYRGLGRIHYIEGRFAAALPQLEHALAHRNGDVQTLQLLAQSYSKLRDRGKSIATLRRLVQITPRDAVALFNLAVELKAAAQYDDALATFERVLEIDRKHVTAWIGVGTVHSSSKRYEAAAVAYRRALELDKGSVQAHLFLANTLLRLSKVEDAAPLLASALRANRPEIAADPNLRMVFLPAANMVGAARNRQRDWAAAVRILTGALSIDSEYAPAHVNLAIAHMGARRLEAAVASYRRAHAMFARGHDEFSKHWRKETAQRIARLDKQVAAASLLLESIRAGSRISSGRSSGAANSRTGSEYLAAAALAFERAEHILAVKCYRETFEAFPRLLAKTSSGFDAARAALRAASEDRKTHSPSSDYRAELRAQALEWFRAGLVRLRARSRRRTSYARLELRRILEDAHLATMRSSDKQLAADERKAWHSLWESTQQLANELEAQRRQAHRAPR